MHQHTHHLLINGKPHPISDCNHWRLDKTGPSCAKGFDLEQHPCAGCELYAARADDPLRRSKPKKELAAISTRINFGNAAKPSPGAHDQPETTAGASRPGLLSQAMSWLKAEASVLVAKVPDDQYEARIAACRSCPELEPLPAPQVGHCKACGCGKRARAELTVKGRLPAAKCPKKLWK